MSPLICLEIWNPSRASAEMDGMVRKSMRWSNTHPWFSHTVIVPGLPLHFHIPPYGCHYLKCAIFISAGDVHELNSM